VIRTGYPWSGAVGSSLAAADAWRISSAPATTAVVSRRVGRALLSLEGHITEGPEVGDDEVQALDALGETTEDTRHVQLVPHRGLAGHLRAAQRDALRVTGGEVCHPTRPVDHPQPARPA